MKPALVDASSRGEGALKSAGHLPCILAMQPLDWEFSDKPGAHVYMPFSPSTQERTESPHSWLQSYGSLRPGPAMKGQ